MIMPKALLTFAVIIDVTKRSEIIVKNLYVIALTNDLEKCS